MFFNEGAMQIFARNGQTDHNFKGHLDYFYHWESTTPNSPFLVQPIEGALKTYSYQEGGRSARKVAAYLTSLDLPSGSTIGILSKNCADWIICDLGIMMAGHISVPFYPNLDAPKLNMLIEHSEIRLLFIGKLDEEDWENMHAGIPSALPCIGMQNNPNPNLTSWEESVNTFRPMEGQPLYDPDHWATIIYTSGTTGNPKGAIHSYRSMANTYELAKAEVARLGMGGRFFSYLPLCHVAERVVVEIFCIRTGGSIWFAQSLETFGENLKNAQPSAFLAVPRVWERFQQKVLEHIPQNKLNWLLIIPGLSHVVKRKIKKQMGLSKANFILSGAAPLSSHLMDWFSRIGIQIREGYGMTETFALATANPADRPRPGTVGIPFPGVEVKLAPKTNEILIKAGNVMLGYYKEPEATEKALRDGYLHTGDVGAFDEYGYLKIVGRRKEIFKTSKGEYIVPTEIEMKLIASELIGQACVLGLNLPQPLALATLSDYAKKKENGELMARLKDLVERTNQKLVDYQRIKKIIILSEEWTIVSNELTPTLKIKRDVIQDNYQNEVKKWYGSEEQVIMA